MEPEIAILCSQDPVINSYPEPDKQSPPSPSVPKIYLNIFRSSTPGSSALQCFPNKFLRMYDIEVNSIRIEVNSAQQNDMYFNNQKVNYVIDKAELILNIIKWVVFEQFYPLYRSITGKARRDDFFCCVLYFER